MYSTSTIIGVTSKSYMSPLAEKYKKHTKLREIKCSGCGYLMATRMKIPRCKQCGAYTEEKK